MNACPMVWELAGRPALAEAKASLFSATPGVCAMCARNVDQTAQLAALAGNNFTDTYWLSDQRSTLVCQACAWALSGRGTASVRLWTVLAAPDRTFPASNPKAWIQNTPGLMLTSRGDTRPILEMLTEPPAGPWVVSIATSGQKHVLPFARVNHGSSRWTIRMESTSIGGTPEEFSRIIRHVACLRAAKHPPDSVLTLTPRPMKSAAQFAEWREHAEPLMSYRGSPTLELALWCLTKETIDDYAAA